MTAIFPPCYPVETGHGEPPRDCVAGSRRSNDAVRRSHFAILGIAVLTGCGTLASSYDTNKFGGASMQGVPYSLPMIKLRAAVVRDANGIAILVGHPAYFADPAAPYLLSYRPSASSVDTLKVKVDNQGLLSAVNGEADDQTAAILEALGKLAGGVAGAIPEAALNGNQVLFDQVFDPSDPAATKAVQDGINLALKQRVRIALQADCGRAIRQALAVDLPTAPKARLKKISELTSRTRELTPVCVAESGYVPPDVVINLDYQPFTFGGRQRAPCTVGVCTRRLHPAVLTFSSGGIAFASESFAMPNRSDPVPMDLTRTAFAKSTYGMTFNNGVVATSDRTKGSELLAIANAPLAIIKGVFTTLAEVVQLRVNLTNNEKTLLESEKGRLEAEENLKKVRDVARKASNAEASLDPDNMMLKAYIPGLGLGSGAGLTGTAEIPNAAEKPKPQPGATAPGQTPPSAGKAAPQSGAATDAESELGGQVKQGNDGDPH